MPPTEILPRGDRHPCATYGSPSCCQALSHGLRTSLGSSLRNAMERCLPSLLGRSANARARGINNFSSSRRRRNVKLGFAGLCGGDYHDQARSETIVLVEDRASITELILAPCRAVNNYGVWSRRLLRRFDLSVHMSRRFCRRQQGRCWDNWLGIKRSRPEQRSHALRWHGALVLLCFASSSCFTSSILEVSG